MKGAASNGPGYGGFGRNLMNNKIRKHSLCEKRPYIAVALSMIIPALIVGAGGILGEKFSSDAGNVGMCIFAVITMLVFRLWFSPDFKGFVKSGCSAKDICIVMIPWGILVVFTLIEPLFLQRPFYFNPSLSAVVMGLAAGFGEETMFRILSLAIVMRYVKKEKRYAVMIILAVIFGLCHAGNVTQGADPVMTAAQVIHSVFLAFLFTGLYLGTGSAVFPVFAHGLHDFICFTTDPSLSADGIITQQYATGQLLYELVLAVIIGIASLCLLNKNKLTKVDELWNEKWSN